MNLFTENITLKQMNEILVNELPKYELIGDVPLTRDEFAHLAARIGLFYDRGVNYEIFSMYKESLSTFLVFCAVYEYDDRTFWKSVEKYVGEVSIPHRNKMYLILTQALIKYNKKLFESESEEGYSHVTPILCHAGIPVNAYDSFFSAISNTMNDNFYDDFSLDDYNTYLKNKTEMTVKRYLKLCDRKSAYQFIQDTRNCIMGLVTLEVDQLNGNHLRMMNEVSNWIEKPKVKKNLNARNNVRISAPQIKIDADGIGVYCILPQIIINESYDSYVIWEIHSDEKTDLVKSAICRKERTLFSEEKEIVLRPASIYEVSLKLEDNTISKWEYQGIHSNFIAFYNNGNIIKSDSLPNNNITLLLDKYEEIYDKDSYNIIELSSIPYWNEFSVYKIDLCNVDILQCSSCNIRISSDNKPIIEGGEKLLSQSSTNVYVGLPYLKVPALLDGDWHIEVMKKSEKSILRKISMLFTSDNERIYLSEIISDKDYGCYQIKIWHHSGISGKYNIEYVPYSNFVESDEYWPSEYRGYINDIVTIRTASKIEIIPFNADEVSQINHETYCINRFRVKKSERYFIGDYIYFDGCNLNTTTIKKNLHPVSWGIAGINKETVELTSMVYSFTVGELGKAVNPILYIALDFSQNKDIQNLVFEMKDRNNKEVNSETFVVKDKDGLRISLDKYLIDIQRQEIIDISFYIKLKDNMDRTITAFTIARVQDEVVVENSLFSENGNVGVIEWVEKGTKINRECILVNFIKPWLKPLHKEIVDGECNLSFCINDIACGIYKYTIQKVQDQLFASDENDEISTLRDFRRGFIKVKGVDENQTDMQLLLSELLRTRFMKKEMVEEKLKKLDIDLEKMQPFIPTDIFPLSYAYIVIDRHYRQKEDNVAVLKIFDKMFDMFSIYSKDTMKVILDSSLTNMYKKILIHKFYCNNLTSLKGINDIQKKLLGEIDEDATGFLYFAENDPRGLNWAGISDISLLKKEEVHEDIKSVSFLSEGNLGRSTYITQFFEFLYKNMQRPKNIDKSTEEFLKEFLNENKVEETYIFGRTRLRQLVEWKEEHKRNAKEIEKILSKVMLIPCEEGLHLEYKIVFSALNIRRNNDELGYYEGLIALYASFIRYGLMNERKEFSRLLNYTIENTGKLYYRDTILFELYLHSERGLEWA